MFIGFRITRPWAVPGNFFSEFLVGVCSCSHNSNSVSNRKNKICAFLCPKRKANNFKSLLCVKMREAMRAREAVRDVFVTRL